METINDLISFQARGLELAKFENELLAIRAVNDRPESIKSLLRLQTLEWMNSLSQDSESDSKLKMKSVDLRELGNKLYRKAPKENALKACQYYTQAIFCAPSGETLALAHANRALALQKFGYNQQAYDDCECALEQGYPEKLRYKLWSRQAFCALQMRDAARLKKHLDLLMDSKQIGGILSKTIEELKNGLKELQSIIRESKESEGLIGQQRQKTQILESSLKGRYMITTEPVAKCEQIFNERAVSFVPVGGKFLCQQCGATQIIPFPCSDCHGSVVYCSLKCRLIHQSTHKYECIAYQKKLFEHVGIAHLAFRILIDNTSEIVQSVERNCDKPFPDEVWQDLTSRVCVPEEHPKTNVYNQTMNLITHLDKLPGSDIIWFALISKLLALYLREFTRFFCLFSTFKIDHDEIELLIASLVLRHIGQLIVNGHTGFSLCRKSEMNSLFDIEDFDLLAENLWASPRHIRRGFLHQFCHFEEVYAANYPYLSICNHACEPTFKIRYSGRFIETFSLKRLEVGEEVFNCYTLDYRKSRKSIRWNHLKETYCFQCECDRCCQENVDEDYEQFNRYRCDQPDCRQVFTIDLEKYDNWWELIDKCVNTHLIKCSICHKPQNCDKRHLKFNLLLKGVKNRNTRYQLYAYFDYICTFLIDYNQLKLFYALEMVMGCFEAHIAGSHLYDDEILILIKALKFYLLGVSAQSDTKSIEYVARMTYLWDLIALGKYKPDQDEMRGMLEDIEILSDEMQEVFRNYYKDYIFHNLD